MKFLNKKVLTTILSVSTLFWVGTSIAADSTTTQTNSSGEPLSLIYGIDDDSDKIFFYDLTNNVDGIVSDTKLPDEMENLTWWQGNAYYSFQSFGSSESDRHADLYRITIDYSYNPETLEHEFTADWVKKFTLEGIDDIDSVELIDGYFYFTDNRTDIFYKMDGTLNTIEKKYVGKDSLNQTLLSKVEGLAYDTATKILYATNVRYDKSSNRSQLFAIYLGNGFNNMEINFLGNLPYYKVEGLVFTNGVLYGAGTSKDVQPDGSYGMFFEINFDTYGNVIPLNSDVIIPKNSTVGNIAPANKDLYLLTTTNKPVNNWKADVEGIANVYCERHDGGSCTSDYTPDLCHVSGGSSAQYLRISPNDDSTYTGHAPGAHGGDYLLNGRSITLRDGTVVDGRTCGDYSIENETPDTTDDPVPNTGNENSFGRINIYEIK